MLDTPFPRIEAERIAAFDKDLAEAWRMGRAGDVEKMRGAVAGNLKYWRAQLSLRWKQRNRPLHLRSSEWPEPIRSEVAARWDDYDRQQHKATLRQDRRSILEAVTSIRWTAWTLARLSDAGVIAEIEAGPSYEYLHWGVPMYLRGEDRMAYTMPTLLDNKGRVVAMVTREPRQLGHTRTMKAWILSGPGATASPPADWSMFHQRKQAVNWIVEQLHRKWCIRLFGNEVDIPEYRP